jgi:hypothetical protein
MSGERKGIRELAEQFKTMEAKHDLFSRKTEDGVYYWDVFRYMVYMTILSRNGIYENTDIFLGQDEVAPWKKLVKALRLFPDYLINECRFAFLLSRRKKYCFLKISRFQDDNGRPVDLLFQDIYEQVRDDAFVMEYFRHPSFRWLKQNIKNGYFLYPLQMSLLLKKEKKDDWGFLSQLINKEFEVDVSWPKAFQASISKYRKEYRFFSSLFRRIKPGFLFFQSDPKGMIAAANDLGILTLDLQHGHINNVGMTYSYPTNVDLSHVNSIPSIVLTLGEFWNRIIDFPNRKITCGSSYFYIPPDKDSNKKKGVMAVSGLFIHNFLARQIAELAKRHPEIVFYYKLHSNQGHQIKECKAFFDSYENVNVIYTEKNVKEIMEDCFAIALVQSSVAYQALQKGLKVFIFKHAYYEASYEIFNQDGVYLVDGWKDLSDNMDSFKNNKANSPAIYFQPYDPLVIKKLLDLSLN